MLEPTSHQLREFLSKRTDQLKASLQGRELSKLSLSLRKNTQLALPTAPSSAPLRSLRSTKILYQQSRAHFALLQLPSCTPLRLAPCAPSDGMDSREPSHQPMRNKNFAGGCAPRFPRELHPRRQPHPLPNPPPTTSPTQPTPPAQPAPLAQPAKPPTTPPSPSNPPNQKRVRSTPRKPGKQSMWSWMPMTSGKARADFSSFNKVQPISDLIADLTSLVSLGSCLGSWEINVAHSMLKMIIFNVPRPLPHEKLPATCSHMEQITSDKTRTTYGFNTMEAAYSVEVDPEVACPHRRPQSAAGTGGGVTGGRTSFWHRSVKFLKRYLLQCSWRCRWLVTKPCCESRIVMPPCATSDVLPDQCVTIEIIDAGMRLCL